MIEAILDTNTVTVVYKINQIASSNTPKNVSFVSQNRLATVLKKYSVIEVIKNIIINGGTDNTFRFNPIGWQ